MRFGCLRSYCDECTQLKIYEGFYRELSFVMNFFIKLQVGQANDKIYKVLILYMSWSG